jgi:hypothetical protein
VKRHSPLKSKSRLKPRRATPRRSSRVVDDSYRERVRSLQCTVLTFLPQLTERDIVEGCKGPSHAHHMRILSMAGMGNIPNDDLCVNFCERHHDNWHTLSGPFAGTSKEWRYAFALAAVQLTRSRLGWYNSENEEG